VSTGRVGDHHRGEPVASRRRPMCMLLPRPFCAPTSALLGLLVLTSCGDISAAGSDGGVDQPDATDTAPRRPPRGMVPAGYDGRFRATVTVLQSPGHGPQLCYALAESNPPQCAGPDIVGWRWDDVDVDAESASGTAWGDYEVTGTFIDGVFTLTDPAQPAGPPPPPRDGPATRCPTPEAGWVPSDPSRATQRILEDALRVAERTPGFGGAWIGWLIPTTHITESAAAGPANYVLNVLTTGDVATMDQAVRDIWGGNLCVSTTEHSESELNRIADQLSDLSGVTSSAADVIRGRAEATAWVVTDDMWRQAVERFGADVIQLDSILTLVD